MALTVRKLEKLPTVTVAAPQQHAPLQMAAPPSSRMQITGVTGAPPSRQISPVARPMDNPLAWFGNTLKDYASGVADVLNPVTAYSGLSRGIATVLSYNSQANKDALASQEALQEQNIELMQRASQAIRDPKTSPAERIRWQNFVRSQSHLAGTNQFNEATDANEAAIAATDPVAGALNLVSVAGGIPTGKAAVNTAAQLVERVAGNKAKQEALDYLVRQATVGTKNVPVTTVGGGDVPIPTRVSTKIPVQEIPSDEILTAKPKVAVKEQAAPALADEKLLNIKIKNVKDPTRKAELIAEREARFPKKEKPLPQLAQDIDKAMEGGVDKAKGPGVAQRVFGSISNYLERSGNGGKLINRGLHNSRDYFEKNAGNAMVNLRGAGFKPGMSDETVAKVWDAIESADPSKLSSSEKKLATGIVKVIQQVRKDAVDAGMDIGDLGDTYLPRWYKDGDPEMISLFSRKFNQRFGNLEKKRLTNEEGYEKTAEALARYVQRSYERIGRAKEFGQNDENLLAMLNLAQREAKDVKSFERLKRYTENVMGDNQQRSGWHTLSDVARQYEAYTSLQRSAFANVGQSVNTMTVAGFKNWGKAVIKYATDKNARDWAERTGVYGDHILGSMQHQYAGVGGGEFAKNAAVRFFKKHVAVPGMQAVEKFNRANSVLAGKAYAEDLLKKSAKGNRTARRQLNDYFPTLKQGEEVTDEMITDAARKLVKKTQFKVDPLDLPNWATENPVGKLIFQFRSFGYRQTNFLAREVIGEALHGNFAPMARFLAAGVPVGTGITIAKDEVKKAASGAMGLSEEDTGDSEKSDLEKAFAGFSQIGGGGLPLSEASNLYNNIKYGNTTLETIANLAGPTLSDVARAAGATDDALRKGDWKTAATFAASQIPILGPQASDIVKKSMKGNTTDPGTMTSDELDKYKKTVYAKFTEGMSTKDKDLVEATSNDDYARLGLKSGKFTQDQIDNMQAKINRNNMASGLPVKYINSLSEEDFNNLSDELKALTLEASLVGKTKFKDSTEIDKTSEAVIAKALESAWPEVGDVKANNKLALEYLKSQTDYAKADNDSAKLDIVKGFWNKAVKQQYAQKTQDIYGNALGDIKRLKEGITIGGASYAVSDADIADAVALDDRLLAAGLRDTPKFSNKTRREWGYADAATSKIGSGYDGKSSSGGRSARGGSSSSAESNPYRLQVSRGSRSKLSGTASSSGGRASVRLASTPSGSVSKPKVSLKKNKV